jgi:hypothetical protein
MPDRMNGESCTRKHATWFVPFFVCLIGMVVTVVGITTGKAAQMDLVTLDNRVRQMEATISRQDERLKRIEEDTKWIRTKLEARP